MIKCPKCGSTAQVKLVYGDDLAKEIFYSDLHWIFQDYECGCGCKFEVRWKKEGVYVTNDKV